MLSFLCAFVTVFVCAQAGGQSPLAQSAQGGRQVPRDVVIFAERGAEPNYHPRSSYGFVPVLKPDSTMTSRRNDIHPQRLRASQKSAGYRLRADSNQAPVFRKPIRLMARPFRRNDQDGALKTPERYSQTIKSTDGTVAIPIEDSNRGSAAANSGANPSLSPGEKPQTNAPQSSDRYLAGIGKLVLPNPTNTKNIASILLPNAIRFPGVVYNTKNPLPAPPPVLVDDFKPYGFGYGINDGLGTIQFRQESTPGDGAVSGNYGYKDFQGIFRQVNYIADKDGFRAVIRTNEPGVSPVDTADVSVILDPPATAAVVENNRYLYKNDANAVIL